MFLFLPSLSYLELLGWKSCKPRLDHQSRRVEHSRPGLKQNNRLRIFGCLLSQVTGSWRELNSGMLARLDRKERWSLIKGKSEANPEVPAKSDFRQLDTVVLKTHSSGAMNRESVGLFP
jgi:hypothetical protein